jgi:hypothetical protein
MWTEIPIPMPICAEEGVESAAGRISSRSPKVSKRTARGSFILFILVADALAKIMAALWAVKTVNLKDIQRARHTEESGPLRPEIFSLRTTKFASFRFHVPKPRVKKDVAVGGLRDR